MAQSQLPNYLLAHRKRLGLSQDEVAYLLGAEDGGKVCRYERYAREPGFRAALAYEAIYQRPIREVFAGLFRQIEQEVAERAKALAVNTDGMKLRGGTGRKREVLERIAGTKTKKVQKP
jgi:transcriptional regulator with XRE-family HTH domain